MPVPRARVAGCAASQARERVASVGGAGQRVLRVVDGGGGQAEQDHRAVAHEAGDDALVGDRDLFDEAVEIVEQFAHDSGAGDFREAGEAGQVDEDDRGFLADRFGEEIRVAGQPFAQRRRLEALQQRVLAGETLRAAAVEPDLRRAEGDGRRDGCGRKAGQRSTRRHC